MASSETPKDDLLEDEGRRDFFTLATIGMGAIGGAVVAWPFIDSLNPSADHP